MGEVIGYCGLICSNCDIYKATENDDNDLREIVFNRQIEWGHGDRFQRLYGREYLLEDIHCEGCPTESERAFWYIHNCQMRTCALKKNLANCAFCNEYPCEKLQTFFNKSHVDARKTLDEIRARANVVLKNGSKSVIRRFTKDDKARVADMMSSLSEEAVRWGMPPYTKERLERGWWSNYDNLLALVAECDNRIVGYAQIRKQTHPRRRGVGGFIIYLHQDYHNLGLGTEMTKYIIELANEADLHKINLQVIADNEIAVHVYEKLGFKIEGIITDSFYGDDDKYHDELHMGLKLSDNL